MRLTIAFILSIIFAVGLVAFGFTFYQSSSEKTKLKSELELHTTQIAKEIFAVDGSFFEKLDQKNINRFADSLIKQYNLLGMAIYFTHDYILSNYSASSFINYSKAYIYQSITSDTSVGNFFKSDGEKIYQYIRPIKQLKGSNNAVVFYTDAGQIDKVLRTIWFRNFMGWFVQAFLVSLVTLLTIRWGLFKQINKIVDWAKALRTGNIRQLKPGPHMDFLDPLHKEIESIAKAMNEAKATAEEEARLKNKW